MANEIAAAIKILEQERDRIDTALRALKGVSGTQTRGGSVSSGSGKTRKKRKPLSTAARKRIAEAQRARWAKQRAGK